MKDGFSPEGFSQSAPDSRALPAEPARPSPSSELSERESVPVEGKARNKPYARTARSEDQSRSESSELPYPEAPLASRRADFKKPPRYIDPEVLRAFHDTQPDCLTCGYYRVSAHHLVPRSKSGDDVAANLIPLCGMCHGCLHSGGKWQAYGASMTADAVRGGIGRFLRSEAGEDHLNYVKTKLGAGAAAFLSRYGVEDE